MVAAFLLFCGAALLEAFVSPRPTFFWGVFGDAAAIKRGIAIFSSALLVLYIVGLGGVSWGAKRGWLSGASEEESAKGARR